MYRPITETEAQVVAWLLAHPQQDEPLGPWLTAPNDLSAKSGCDCGCASIEFSQLAGSADECRPIRKAAGHSADGRLVLLILWGTAEEVSELEVMGLDGPGQLPELSTLRTWDTGEAS